MYSDEDSKEEIRRIIEGILNGDQVPQEWCEASILPIHKKGDATIASNYRGIAIGNAIYKLIASIVNERLKCYVETNQLLPDTQNGFREDRSVVDNIYIINQCIQKSISRPDGKLYMLFVDYKAAFDFVDRGILFEVLKQLKIPAYIRRTIEGLYKTTTYNIEGERFESHRGLKQGCPLSPLLFALYIAALNRVLKGNQLGGVVVGGTKIYSLEFADDIALMAERPEELKDMIRALQRFSARRRLQISVEKSKVIMFSKGSRKSGVKWDIGGQSYEEVESFVYLGVELQRNGQFTRHQKAVARKVNKRATEVWSLGERLFPSSYPTRLQMWHSLVLPIILYAAEVTGFGDYDRYEAIQRRYFKWTLGLPKGTRSAVVYTEAGVMSVKSLCLARALKYENSLPTRLSVTLRAAHTEMVSGAGHRWKESRRCRMNELGWAMSEAERRLAEPQFWVIMHQRQRDQEIQLRRAATERLAWYQPPEQGRPQYLRTNFKDYKTVSRFRCGAEARTTETWRGSAICRMCNVKEETMNHLVECYPVEGSRDEKELWCEDGRGKEWMLSFVAERNRRMLIA